MNCKWCQWMKNIDSYIEKFGVIYGSTMIIGRTERGMFYE